MSKLRTQYYNKLMMPLYIGLVVTTILCFTGVILSLILENWNVFSRIGALIVIVGLLIAKWDLDNLIKNKVPIAEIEKSIHEIAKQVIPTKQLSNDDVIDIKNQTHIAIVTDIKPKYTSAEIYIVSLGTLIWGFGDLVQKFYT